MGLEEGVIDDVARGDLFDFIPVSRMAGLIEGLGEIEGDVCDSRIDN